MKFRVARDDLADAVAWVAKSLPTRPPVPVLGGILLEVEGSTLTVAGFDYEVSTRARGVGGQPGHARRRRRRGAGDERVLVSGRLLAEITRALPAKPVDVAVDGPRVIDRRRIGAVHAADHAGRGLPAAAADARRVGHGRRGDVRRGGRADRGGGRPRRHAADADRDPGGDRGRHADPGGDRPVPAGGPRAAAGSRTRRTCPPPCWCRPARWPTRPRPSAAPPQVTVALGDGLLGLQAGGRRTTVRLLDVEFVKYRSLLPTSHTTTVDIAGRRAGRVDQAGRAGHRPRSPPADAGRRRLAHPDRRRRRRGPGRGGAAGRCGRRRTAHRVQPGYLLDGLGALHSPTVRLAFTTPSRPALLVPIGADPAEDAAEAATARRPGRRDGHRELGLPLPGDAGPAARLMPRGPATARNTGGRAAVIRPVAPAGRSRLV